MNIRIALGSHAFVRPYLGEMEVRIAWNNVLGHYRNHTTGSRTNPFSNLQWNHDYAWDEFLFSSPDYKEFAEQFAGTDNIVHYMSFLNNVKEIGFKSFAK